MKKMTATMSLGLLAAACSNESGKPTETEVAAEQIAPAGADDDTLEPEATKVEEGEKHNEDAPHSH